ncbi:MAG: glycine cleavage system aminomethyltransferase GcvT [Phycisphaerae bacterium]|jgi:aminomethyltransferase|nr:glycine cleavage system aminomethyltransferase GcvT [Phycisphaerae bacterium]
MSSKTPLYDRHVALGGRVVDFAGWMLPVQYEGVLAEHKHCRTSAVVFDTSHMGQFLICGPDAAGQLSRIGTQDAQAMARGACKYGFLLNVDAGVIDDTILMRLGFDEFLLVVNAGPAAGDFHWLSEHLKGAVKITNRSDEGWGKIDLQGPLSARILQPVMNIDLMPMGYYKVRRGECCGRKCVISRTGYTGELGYEIMAPGADLQVIFDELLARDEVKPAGLGARDSLRLEMGYPLYGHELSVDHNPVEAGLGNFIDPEGGFIGSRRVGTLIESDTPRKLVAFRAESRRRTNPGNEILWDGQPAGSVTSGAFSPSLEVSIGMGYVRSPLAEPGRQLVVDTGRCELRVTVCGRPLYRNGTCRTRTPL